MGLNDSVYFWLINVSSAKNLFRQDESTRPNVQNRVLPAELRLLVKQPQHIPHQFLPLIL